jgi:hypothetical protein
MIALKSPSLSRLLAHTTPLQAPISNAPLRIG